ncbi:MAG: hypothetical protein LW816_20590 [Planctomyces sp.]|nr:hypothetical protein [Planctomyces sp.]
MLLSKLQPQGACFGVGQFERFLYPGELGVFFVGQNLIAPELFKQSAPDELNSIAQFFWLVLVLRFELTDAERFLLFFEAARDAGCDCFDAFITFRIDQVVDGRLDPFDELCWHSEAP